MIVSASMSTPSDGQMGDARVAVAGAAVVLLMKADRAPHLRAPALQLVSQRAADGTEADDDKVWVWGGHGGTGCALVRSAFSSSSSVITPRS